MAQKSFLGEWIEEEEKRGEVKGVGWRSRWGQEAVLVVIAGAHPSY